MSICLITPPMTQLNTPYPATAFLAGYLKSFDYHVSQKDGSIEFFLRIYSKEGLERILQSAFLNWDRIEVSLDSEKLEFAQWFRANGADYVEKVDSAVRFLQGKDPTLAMRISRRDFLPEGPRFEVLSDGVSNGVFESEDEALSWAFGALGTQDRARFIASLFLDDIADFIQLCVDPRFSLSRYAEKLSASAPSLDPLLEELSLPPTPLDLILDELASDWAQEWESQKTIPDVVGWSVPFPGNVYAAFRMARILRTKFPNQKHFLGGGYVNTELRELKEPRVFDFFDAVMLDDGEIPLTRFLKSQSLVRTFVRKEGRVCFQNDLGISEPKHREKPAPSYEGLPLDSYLSILEMLNPMHRLWSDGRWNKLMLAHGCYWGKCQFCDVSLDYIQRYEASTAEMVVDQMEKLVKETGQSGFHFVDEAAPPALLRAVSQEILKRGLVVTWWGNIRFEKTFTAELAELMSRSGCVGISGGLEVASNRILKQMCKGVTVEQVARVTRNFADSGILVHAYLMYGFPSQTAEETIDSLERVRQLFEEGCLHSAYWHRFSVTAHSPIGKKPENYGLRLMPVNSDFARNDLPFEDPHAADPSLFSEGLRVATYNYMHGLGFERDVRSWFQNQKALPLTEVDPEFVAKALNSV